MRTETTTKTIYKFDELSEEVKEEANNLRLRNGDSNPWSDEHRESLKQFSDLFPVTIVGWQYDSCSGWINIKLNEDSLQEGVSDLEGLRLRTWIMNNYGHVLYTKKTKFYTKNKDGERQMNSVGGTTFTYTSKIQEERSSCPFTGYCGDESLLDPIHKFIANPSSGTTLEDLMQECGNSWIAEGVSDEENFQSLEWFADHAEANEYEFDEDGNIH